ncbi:MAG: hypothetical protein ACXWNK_05940 [Vulcanimicrobiaceae bacterium]
MTAVAAISHPGVPSRRLSLSLAASLLIVFLACSGFGRLVTPAKSSGQASELKIIATVVAHPHRAK